MNHCDGTGTFQLFVLQGPDCLYILSICCHKHPALTLEKRTATADNKDVTFGHGWQKGVAVLQVTRAEGEAMAA